MSEQSQEFHAVVYTDGGFKPSHVIGGWGFHGYVYLAQESKTGSGAKNFTPGPKGYLKGTILPMPVTPVEYVNGLGSITKDATNNVAELMGAIRALKFVLERGVKTAHLLLDSQYVLKGLTEFADRWEAAGWIKGDGQPVKNVDLWKELVAAKRAVEAAGIKLTLGWVRGHDKEWSDDKDSNGEPGNAAADELCNRACQAAINGSEIDQVRVSPAKGYWKVKADRNRMLNMPTMLYMPKFGQVPGATSGDYTRYYMTQVRTSKEMMRQALQGKPMSDTQYAVVWLKEPDPVVDTLAKLHDHFASRALHAPLIKFDLAAILKTDNYHSISTTGADYLIMRERNHEVALLDKTVLTNAIDPPRLAFRAFDRLEVLDALLEEYVAETKSMPMIQFTEITDQLYGMVEKGKKSQRKLKGRITSATRTIDAVVAYRTDAIADAATMKLALSLALDLPDRNTLSAVAETVQKVVVVTWPESRHAIRCATILETSDGLGIWAVPHANLHFLPNPSS